MFVFYIVDSEAGEQSFLFIFFRITNNNREFSANVNTQVYVPTETIGISFKGNERYFTVLSSFDALEFSAFQGIFPV